jgi:hypothetical protein
MVALRQDEADVMGLIMIRRAHSGRTISTGRRVDAAAFRSSPVFFSRTYCPECRLVHEWFAKDAWVSLPNVRNAKPSVSKKPPRILSHQICRSPMYNWDYVGCKRNLDSVLDFRCPNCTAKYKLVRVDADKPNAEREITCLNCGSPLHGREGRFILKYFLAAPPAGR